MSRLKMAATLIAVLSLAAATVAFAASGREGDGGAHRADRAGHWRHHVTWMRGRGAFAVARLGTSGGHVVGRVWFKQRRRGGPVLVFARVRGLPPGFHGFHVHTTGACEPPGFTSAGGHLNPTGAIHGDHAGDLPSLLVNESGRGLLATVTDRFSIADLRDADGSAVIVHAGRDNFANIPPRYGTPDRETLNTGDSGARLACGVVR